MNAIPRPTSSADAPLVPLGAALLKLLLHLPVLSRYGYHHDELYFIACGRHFDLGYVDHAPLVPWIARLATTLFGESLGGLRVFAALAGAAAVLLVGLLARQLGGGRLAQLVACLAMLVAPVFLRTGNLFCIPAFEPLFWLGASCLVVLLVQRGDPRLWLAVGLVVGLGLLNKHSMLFFGLGLAVGIAATPLRAQLRTRWPWIGAAAALLVFLPNLGWQAAHGWPTLHFLLDLNRETMAGIATLQFVAGQILYLNPAAAWVWIAGLVFFFSAAGRPYRALGWIWVATFLVLLVAKSKIYYLAPAYPALLAAGGVASARWFARRAKLPRIAALTLLVIGGLAFAPLSVPFLSIEGTDRYVDRVTFGQFENVYELTGDLHGMFGWPERVEAVARAWAALEPAERERGVIWAAGYGTAGAIDHLGRGHGLPWAVSLSHSYWLWGLPSGPIDTVVAAGFGSQTLERVCGRIEILAQVELEHVLPDDREFRVVACREPRRSLPEIWTRNRPW